MIWDKVSKLYDFFENLVNRKVYKGTGLKVAEYISSDDIVLECACGTGAITCCIAPACKKLIATDMSSGMRRETAKKCKKFGNVTVGKADINNIRCSDDSFDKVVAGNVIHLLDDPYHAVSELLRVCRPGGKVMIPTYINRSKKQAGFISKLLNIIGVEFKEEFTFDTYKEFFAKGGYVNVEYFVVDGRMPCAIAVITK